MFTSVTYCFMKNELKMSPTYDVICNDCFFFFCSPLLMHYGVKIDITLIVTKI